MQDDGRSVTLDSYPDIVQLTTVEVKWGVFNWITPISPNRACRLSRRILRRCSFSRIVIHFITHGGHLALPASCKSLILKGSFLGEVVGARGFELLAHSFIQYRRRSPVPHKQRPPLHFPPFPNQAEHRQTGPNLDQLLHTHYTRKLFS
jgi:hypothetical protein